MPKTTSDETVATLTIHRAGDMTGRGRKEVAAWLRRQADALEADGERYAMRFRAAYKIGAYTYRKGSKR